jgi:peptide/nickel transport system ATP-binding protein
MKPMMQAVGLRVALASRSRDHLFRKSPPIEIVRGVDLNLARGSALGLVGESGSGKTTLGRALVRLIRPSAGQLIFDGTDITGLDELALRPLRARMQMIFQDPHSSLNPRLSIGSILGRPLEAFGGASDRASRRARVAELLDLVGLPQRFAERYPHELSGGQRQRVGIARAIALEPDFIVADEIVSGLDVSTQAQILVLLRDLRRRLGLTLVFISHDLSVVRVLCDQVVVLRQGEIVEAGPCADLFATPRHPYTRTLIDAIPLPDFDPGWLDAGVAAAEINCASG